MSGFIGQFLELREVAAPGQDDVLTSIALTLVTLADGTLDREEEAMLDAWRAALPDWHEHAQSATFAERVEGRLNEMIARFLSDTGADDLDPIAFARAGVSELVAIEDEAARKRCFLLCCDMAMASGGITDDEDAVLESMSEVLSIHPATVDQIIGILRLKYRC